MNQQEQFIALIQEHEKIIFKVIAIYEPNPIYQKDLQQEILLQLWKAFPSFKKQAKVSTWMYRIALNTVVTQFRKRKKQVIQTSINETILEIADHSTSAQEESLAVLYQQINQLNDLDKALVLLYLEEKSYAEIATIVGLSITNVASKLSRIKQKMKNNVQ